ncbi:MAG TPA: DUF1178 family protein [Noviherbaspirillum sp.]
MKVYNLTCELDHRFEGWFSSEEDYNTQAGNSLIRCPVCDSDTISRLPSAPHLSLSGAQPPQADSRAAIHSQVLELVRQVIGNTEDVGAQFAEEARRIHYNEAPERAIRGVASREECEALQEEGIDVIAVPIPDVLKQPLQ